MAIFNQSSSSKKDAPPPAADTPSFAAREAVTPPANTDFSPATFPRGSAAAEAAPVAKESLIAADLTIEGKIEGPAKIYSNKRSVCSQKPHENFYTRAHSGKNSLDEH